MPPKTFFIATPPSALFIGCERFSVGHAESTSCPAAALRTIPILFVDVMHQITLTKSYKNQDEPVFYRFIFLPFHGSAFLFREKNASRTPCYFFQLEPEVGSILLIAFCIPRACVYCCRISSRPIYSNAPHRFVECGCHSPLRVFRSLYARGTLSCSCVCRMVKVKSLKKKKDIKVLPLAPRSHGA
jgi:hypothetical protein